MKLFKKVKKLYTQLLLQVRFDNAKKRAHKFYDRINGRESVHVFLVGKRFVVLTRKHTRELIRKGAFKQDFDWSDIKRNAIYSIDKKVA